MNQAIQVTFFGGLALTAIIFILESRTRNPDSREAYAAWAFSGIISMGIGFNLFLIKLFILVWRG